MPVKGDQGIIRTSREKTTLALGLDDFPPKTVVKR